MPGLIPELYSRVGREGTLVFNPECQWVIDGEGFATCRFVGTTIKYINGRFFEECRVYGEALDPDGFQLERWLKEPCRGWKYGWIPVRRSILERIASGEIEFHWGEPPVNGVYQLVHGWLYRHQAIRFKSDPPRDPEGLRYFDYGAPWILGIVWHHNDGRMAKMNRGCTYF